MNPWTKWMTDDWLNQLNQNISASTSSPQSQATYQHYQSQWNTFFQQWQTATEQAWQSPASFWQAVAGIQSARARSLAQFWQQQPQYMQQLFQCTTFPQWVECVSRYNSSIFSNMITLGTITQAQRGHLLEQWQRQFATTTPQALTAMWQQAFKQAAQGTPQNFKSAPNAATPAFTASQAVASTPSVTASSATSSSSTVQATNQTAAATPTSQQTLFNGTDTATSSAASNVTPITSSTANSVMRSSAGATIASSAAARRSVVARRMSSQRRRAPR